MICVETIPQLCRNRYDFALYVKERYAFDSKKVMAALEGWNS